MNLKLPPNALPKFPIVPIRPKPPAPERVAAKVEVRENDPGLRVGVNGTRVTVSGVGTNNGFVPSVLQLKVDGRSINVPIAKGDTARDIAAKVRAQLPKGYELKVDLKALLRGEFAFQITRPALPRTHCFPQPLDRFER